jgi:hypothetical protein
MFTTEQYRAMAKSQMVSFCVGTRILLVYDLGGGTCDDPWMGQVVSWE